MNIIEALEDKNVLGSLPAFGDLTTWTAWLAFLRAVYGLPMSGADLALFRKHTGRTTPRPGGYPEAICICGRQAGKSQITSAVASFEAATSSVRGGHVLLVAQDLRGAQRALLRYCREAFGASSMLAHEVVRETSDTLELQSGVSLSVYPCRPAAVRGIRAPLVVLDEVAYYISSEGREVDREMLRAVRPTLATTGGRLLILSSPYGQRGLLWDLHRQNYGNEDSAILVFQATAPELNPTLPADYLERMAQDDPEAYRSEVLGEFRAGVSSLFDPEALEACVDHGRRESPRQDGAHYAAHYDPSGGRHDAASLAIGHREQTGLLLVDLVRRWPSPHNPEAVIAEAAGTLKSYNLRSVQVDRFAGQFPAAAFIRHGIRANVAPGVTSDHHLGLLPLVNAGQVRFPDVIELLRELRGLERRTGNSGKDRADHRPGATDDVAAAVSGLCALLPARRRDIGITL